ANAVAGDVQVQYQECTQLIQALGQQGQYGDSGAVSGDIGSAAASEIAQELGICGAAGGAAAGGAAAAAAGGVLPETGGASLIALGAGALLVAGGLLARRIAR
ncbi:MAG: hypothetical protein IN808_04010, partial [Rubrobacter sp.]|nr:hypothetical protein [Rubrobacter sp.]